MSYPDHGAQAGTTAAASTAAARHESATGVKPVDAARIGTADPPTVASGPDATGARSVLRGRDSARAPYRPPLTARGQVDSDAIRRQLRGGGPPPELVRLRALPHVRHVQNALAAARSRAASYARERRAGWPVAREHANALADVRNYRAHLAELQVATW